MISFTAGQTLFGDLSNNSSAENLARYGKLANIEQKYLLQKYFSNEGSFTDTTVAQQQFYKLPPNYSKLKTVTISVGNLTWTPTEIRTREQWDQLNVFPYYSDIPNNFYIFPGGDHNGRVGIWPIPSSNGNTITYNYKFRVPDLSIADYTTPGTVSVANGSRTVTGSGTTFQVTSNSQNESRWIQFAPTSSSSTSGDNLWYQIESVDSATSLTLYGEYQGTSITGSSSFTIGQMPIIQEDFQDMLVWKALVYYFSSIVNDPKKKEEFEGMYNQKLELLSEYAGTTTVNVNLSRNFIPRNPNLYGQSFGI